MIEKLWSLIPGSANYAQEIQNLKRENNQLKEQVEQWKGKLISAEKSSGIQQITTSVPEAGEPQQAKSEGNFGLTSDIFGVYLLLRCWHKYSF